MVKPGENSMDRLLKVISRDTHSVRAQLREVMEALGGVAYELCAADDPDAPVLRGEADISACEASRLPYPLRDGLTLAALVREREPAGGGLGVVCSVNRADLRGLFFSCDARNSRGKVCLVGAGCGSADLITLRGQRALAKSDIVYYDDLVDESLLRLSPGEHVYVGKRKGCTSVRQDTINEMLYDSALQGRSVVRLKGGDPSIFGRGGEELDYLRRRWIRVEVVPGVTSASAAAAAGLFSLTQRRVSRSVTFLSGHGIESGSPRSPEQGTVVYYMAASRLEAITSDLLREGVQPDTPVAIVRNAGAADETCIRTTVGSMTGLEVQAPALLIVGATAAFAWIEKKALFTGIDPDAVNIPESIVHQQLIQAAPLSARSPDAHGSPVYRPVSPLPAPVQLAHFSAVVFSSPLTVDAFEDIYGSCPDHLLCYVPDEETRGALLGKGVHPWRIVACPAR